MLQRVGFCPIYPVCAAAHWLCESWEWGTVPSGFEQRSRRTAPWQVGIDAGALYNKTGGELRVPHRD
jgi:hypothetical protein